MEPLTNFSAKWELLTQVVFIRRDAILKFAASNLQPELLAYQNARLIGCC
jgi:hypothetical protein